MESIQEVCEDKRFSWNNSVSLMEVCATLPTRRISKPVSAGLFDHDEHIRVKLFCWAYVQFCDKYLVWQAPFYEPRRPRKLCDCVRKQFHLEWEEREEIIDRALEIYLSKRRITTLSSEANSAEQPPDSDDGHKIDDEHDEDNLDSEDERLSRRINGF